MGPRITQNAQNVTGRSQIPSIALHIEWEADRQADRGAQEEGTCGSWEGKGRTEQILCIMVAMLFLQVKTINMHVLPSWWKVSKGAKLRYIIVSSVLLDSRFPS